MKNLDVTSMITICLVLVILACFWPFAFVWSVNALFGTEIPFNFQTWIASIVLFIIMKGLIYEGKK